MICHRLTIILKFISLFFLFFFLLLDKVTAVEILAWEDCVIEAKKNNPDLVSALEEINRADANKAITMSDVLPHVRTDLTVETSESAWGFQKRCA